MPVVYVIAGGALLVVYALAVNFIFTNIAPDLLTLTSVGATALIPFVYGRTVLRTFVRKRRALQVPVALLLAWVSFDLAFVVLTVVAPLEAHTTPLLGELLGPPALSGLRALGYSIQRAIPPPSLFIWCAVLLGTALKGCVISALLLTMRGVDSTVRATEQPAMVQYFFNEAARDVAAVVSSVARATTDAFVTTARWIHRASSGRKLLALWPLTLTAYAAMVLPALAAVLSLSALLLVHLLGVGLVWATNFYVALLIGSVERAVIRVRTGFVKCPHSGCHKAIPNPIFFCACGTAHNRLMPGRCGVFYRACACGRAKLPTTFALGKGRLPSICNHCRRQLEPQLFSDSVHVPIYGGTSSGKTTFMMAVTSQLVEHQLPSLESDFVRPPDRANYDRYWRPAFASGQVSAKTNQTLPSAFLLWLRRARGLSLSLYLYDPAGEVFEGNRDLEGHSFLQHVHGLVLLVDPMSLRSIQYEYQRAGYALPPTGSSADPLSVLNRIVIALESQMNVARGKRFPLKLAVMFSKIDIPFLHHLLGLTSPPEEPSGNLRAAGAKSDASLRGWLQRHEPALHQVIETRFAETRFFAISALGGEPRPGVPFTPRGVLAPLCWLLSARSTLVYPLRARFGKRVLELAAALVVLVGFTTPLAAGAVYAAASLAELSLPDYREAAPATSATTVRAAVTQPPVLRPNPATARLSRVENLIARYHDGINQQAFDAAQYFAPSVERYLQMKRSTPGAIDRYMRETHPKQFRDSSFEMVPGSLREVQPNVFAFEESFRYFAVRPNRPQAGVVHVCIEVDSNVKLTFYRQFKSPIPIRGRCARQ